MTSPRMNALPPVAELRAAYLEAAIARTFSAFETAAANNTRAPENNHSGVRSEYASILAARGDIRIKIYGYNYRVVEVLTGRHAGKRTKLPRSGRLWKIIDTQGTRRLHPDGSVNLRSVSTRGRQQPSYPRLLTDHRNSDAENASPRETSGQAPGRR